MLQLNLRNPVCFFDLETTGTNITHDRIIEIAVIRFETNGERTIRSHRLNPAIPIPPEAAAIHGITDEDVKHLPTFKEVAKEYARFFTGADLAGFNILRFDLPLLVEEFLRAGVEFDYSRKRIIDAQRIFHLMEKRTLSAAYRFYTGKNLSGAHSAEQDTLASIEVLLAQIDRYKDQPVLDGNGRKIGEIKNDMDVLAQLSASDVVDLAGRIIRNEKGEEIFNFGKHKNKKVADVLRDEPSYYDWMMNGDFPMDTKRKLTEIKLRSFKR
ncbi:MAG: DNA polymerase III subunit epsilon [Cyclobacteriaceae bacterium]|nr:MAG: DNA polymerase III subunit epsilon [Cyclobacteriaceae bacterium]